MKSRGNYKHGGAVIGKRFKEYTVWVCMKGRCYNPRHKKFRIYGGRGIIVCKRWLNSFETFLADMGPRPSGMSLERKNTNGNYEPSNCVWATQKTQQNNRRNNRMLEADGKRLTATQWSKITGISPQRILCRIDRELWTAERALFTPVRKVELKSKI